MYNIGEYLCVDDFNGNIYPYKVIAAVKYEEFDSVLYYLQDVINPSLNEDTIECSNGHSVMAQIESTKYARAIFEMDDCVIPKEVMSLREIEDIIEREKLR